MFRVGAFVLIVLGLILFFGCNEKTSEAEVTGLELGFRNCFTFNARVFIDGNYIGSFSSERASFIDVPAGSHALFAEANLATMDSVYSWKQNFNVAAGKITQIALNCKTPSAIVSDVQVDKTTVVANGIDSVKVTVIVKDWLGNPVPGSAVRIESTGAENIITQPVGLTGADGRAIGIVRSTKAEQKTISVRADETLLVKTKNVTFTAPPLVRRDVL